jgi:hypothetical protein
MGEGITKKKKKKKNTKIIIQIPKLNPFVR